MIKTHAPHRFFWNIPDAQGDIQTTGQVREQRDKNKACKTKDYDQLALLVEDAQTGGRASLEELTELFHKDIFRMVYYRTRSQMDAEDLTQEIFMQMVKSLPNLKDAKCFKAWIFRIAINRVRDFHRKKIVLGFLLSTSDKDETDQMIAGDIGNPAHHMMQKEFWNRFYQFTDCLSRWEREIFLLRFVDHLEIREIAETLKKNENTVKTHLYRALKKFRENPGLHDQLKGEIL